MAKCRWCPGVEIIWAKTVRGRDIPLDYRFDEGEGRELFVIDRIAHVVTEVQRAEVRAAGARLYAPHRRFCMRRKVA